MNPRQALGSGGFVAAACLACCAAPVVAAFGLTAGIGVLAGLSFGIGAAIAVVLLGISAIGARRLRAKTVSGRPAQPVAVQSPTRRP